MMSGRPKTLRELAVARPEDPQMLELMGLAYTKLGMSQKATECAARLVRATRSAAVV